MLEKLIVYVEEYSMAVTLELLLPKLLGDVAFEIKDFQCKNELLKHMPDRLKAYSSWLPANWAIVVLVDRDDDDALQLKQILENMAAKAGLISKTTAGSGKRFQVVNRIAVEELEAWFFGDWPAVRAAYSRVPATIPQKAAYRNSDAVVGGTWEALERVLKKAGYFSGGLRKLQLARDIAPHMDPTRNTSRSFQAFSGAISAAVTWI